MNESPRISSLRDGERRIVRAEFRRRPTVFGVRRSTLHLVAEAETRWAHTYCGLDLPYRFGRVRVPFGEEPRGCWACAIGLLHELALAENEARKPKKKTVPGNRRGKVEAHSRRHRLSSPTLSDSPESSSQVAGR